VTVNATVAPGDSLTATVGADGGEPAVGTGEAAGGTGAGSGGSGFGGAGGGGGGSAVFDGSTPLVVAGGGGGGGNLGGVGSGQAGTLTGPGAGGSNGISFEDGWRGNGMDGGSGFEAGGGGGGGGYFGGGGGTTLGPYGVFGGGGGSSYPSAATAWDTTATPSVTITTSGFGISTTTLPPATPGTAYGPVVLQAGNLGTSTTPYVTTVKWHKVALPRGLRLSSAGVLSGTPNKKLAASPSSVTVQATEKVITLNGKMKVKTKTTVQVMIPLTIT
jgi:hypothetical protein